MSEYKDGLSIYNPHRFLYSLNKDAIWILVVQLFESYGAGAYIFYYDLDEYTSWVPSIWKSIITDCAISTDIIAGFCDETDEEHDDTISLIKEVKFDFAYMFKYSERPKTLAERKFEDNVPEETKAKRLREIMDVQFANSAKVHKSVIGQTFEVLIEGTSKKDDDQFKGRNSQNMVAVFPKLGYKLGDYVQVEITDCTSATLIGKIVD